MKSEKLVFKSSARDFPVSGFTNVKISNDSYVKILAIKSATSKPAQDILNELVEYALDNFSTFTLCTYYSNPLMKLYISFQFFRFIIPSKLSSLSVIIIAFIPAFKICKQLLG